LLLLIGPGAENRVPWLTGLVPVVGAILGA